jgi:hypothetical protein
MKIRIFLIISVILQVQNLKADDSWIIKVGFNHSEFQKIEAKSFVNYSMGIERKIPTWHFLSINPEILWSKQGGIIQNKPVWTDSYYDGSLYRYNINIVRTSMDISIIFDFSILQSNEISLSIRPFPSFHTEGFKQQNVLEKLNRINVNDSNTDWDNYNFEYRQGDFDHYPYDFKTGWSLNLSLMLNYKKFVLETRYMKNLNSIGQIGQLYPLKHKLHSIHFLVGYTF